MSISILTRETVAAAHKPVAHCVQCGEPTALRFSDEFFYKSGHETATGRPIRCIEAYCTANRRHAPKLLDWAFLDALDK